MRIDVMKVQSVLLRLIKRTAVGKKVVVTKDGKPTARLVPPKAGPGFRELGSAKGEFTVPDDFNDPLPKEIEDSFWE